MDFVGWRRMVMKWCKEWIDIIVFGPGEMLEIIYCNGVVPPLLLHFSFFVAFCLVSFFLCSTEIARYLYDIV